MSVNRSLMRLLPACTTAAVGIVLAPLLATPPRPFMPLAQAETGTAIASLPDGHYQFCSQADPKTWQDGAGVCFNFVKTNSQIKGYYGYPHSDRFVCIQGKAEGNWITGEALSLTWADEEGTGESKTVSQWDDEGHLTLSQANVIRTAANQAESANWVRFHRARLDVNGFYRYRQPRMKAPGELCEWN